MIESSAAPPAASSSRLLPGRIDELDAIRGLAALAVVFCHLPLGFWLGETGVDLFFVLSGFLITGIILRNRSRPGFLRTFFFRRSLRIWPIYYVALAVVLLLNQLRGHPEPQSGWPWALFYLQNIGRYVHWDVGSVPNFDHTWTLAIEEQFYLLWPVLLMLFTSRWSFRLLVWATLLIPFVLRLEGIPSIMLLTHSDALALGSLLAAWHSNGGDWRSRLARIAFPLIALAGAAGYTINAGYVLSLGEAGKEVVHTNPAIMFVSLLYLGIVGVVAGHAGGRGMAWLRWRPLVYLGQISYGLYLYHWIIFEWFDMIVMLRWGYPHTWWLGALKVVVSLLVAAASWEWFEKPILAFKDRIGYRRPGPATLSHV